MFIRLLYNIFETLTMVTQFKRKMDKQMEVHLSAR